MSNEYGNIDLEALKRQVDRQLAEQEEETKIVGNDSFMNKVAGINDSTSGSIPDNVTTTKIEPVLSDELTQSTTNSGVTVMEAEKTNINPYEGPGLVVTKDEIVTDDQIDTMPKYTGITPDTNEQIDNYMGDFDKELEEAKAEVERIKAEQAAKKTESSDEDSDEDDEKTTEMTKDEFNEKYDKAVIIIDKTNFGHIIDFTDEEREKLEKSKKIKLEEIETVSLESIRTKKIKKKSDFDKILKKVTNITTTNIVLPVSGYTASIRGCSVYELISLIEGNDNAMLDAQNKWSLIHNKLESTSIGKMDFNEFLLNTAAADYNTFIYGLLCSTYPDDDELPLNCEKCKKEFKHKYSVRSLIRAEAMSEKLQDIFMNVVDSSISEEMAKETHDNAAISVVKRVRLPISGIIAEVYVQSAYDLINKSIKDLTDNKDVKYNTASILSTLIRTLYIPDEDEEGSFFEVDNSMDITKTLYSMNGTDVLVIRKLGEEILNDMNIEYGLMNVTCPYCGHYTPSIPLDLENILFYKYRQQVSTEIE